MIFNEMVRKVKLEDAKQIAEIYNYYILNTIVTFEETSVSIEEMKGRIITVISKFPWLVYESEGEIKGYAYGSEWKSRCAYKYSLESSVYLKHDEIGKGIGSRLYEELLEQLRALDFHAVIGGISLPNEKSISLHEKFGFKKIAQFHEVGYKFEKWIDVGYWELILGKSFRP